MKNLLAHRVYLNPLVKPWIIFIHGIGGNSSTFCLQLKAFKDQFNILMPDLRGHGMSVNLAQPEAGKYSLELIANDVFKLMDYHNIEKSNFIGCSFGASIIRVMEKIHPQRFNAIVLTGAVLKINTGIYMIMKLGKVLSPYINNHFLYSMVAYFIMPYANHKESRRLFIQGSKMIPRKEYRSWLGILEEIKHRMDELYPYSFISKDVLLVSGNEDHVFLNDCVRFCHHHKTAKIVVLQDCGHVSSIEKYDKFNHLALNFIQNKESANAIC